MEINNSSICFMCEQKEDIVEHLLLLWNEARQLWSDVENWITQIGFGVYKINDTNILVGELEGILGIDSIFTIQWKKGKRITLVKNEMKNFYFKENTGFAWSGERISLRIILSKEYLGTTVFYMIITHIQISNIGYLFQHMSL